MSAGREQAEAASTATFVTALVLNVAIAGAEIAIFTLIRRQFKTIYEPRTFIPQDEKKRPGHMASSLLGWPMALWRADPVNVWKYNGLDAYVYLRYLRMMIKILLPIWLLSWVVLLPVDAAGTSVDGKSGLDKFTFGNISNGSQQRLAAHLIAAWLFTAWICYNLQTEMKTWVTLRQRHLVSEEHSSLPQSRTVLITGIPNKYLDEVKLTQLFHHLPGGAQHVWLNRDLKDMPDTFNARIKATKKLESATTALIKTAAKLKIKDEKKAKKSNGPLDDKWSTANHAESDSTLAERLVPAAKRPQHRNPQFSWLPFALPFFGKKVDTIDWCKDEIVKHTETLEGQRKQLQADIDEPGIGENEVYRPLNSAFILFHQQIAAHLAVQSLVHNEPYTMNGRYLDMSPADVIWSNLSMNPYEQQIRKGISWAITLGLIIFWAIPVSFVGIVSNISTLCSQSWLAWICKLPKVVQGIITGVLPPVLLAVLFMLLPIILRLLAKFEGIPRKTGVELSLMTRYTIFLTIHGFIITTLAAGIIPAIKDIINNPSSVATVLAAQLPRASTFFLTYITLQGIAGSAGNFIQYVALALYYVKLTLLGSTPRSVYNIKYTMRDVSWGTVFPNSSLITIIALGYMIISPIINGLACFSFFLLYCAWKYLFTWVYDQDPAFDTGGLFFPKAITHVFVGMYIGDICLAALFFLARNSDGNPSAIPQGALMVVLIVFTICFQITLLDSYGPLKTALPLTLAHKAYGMPQESGHSGSVIGDEDEQENLMGRPSTSTDKEPLRRPNDDRHADQKHSAAPNGSGVEGQSAGLPDPNQKPPLQSRPSGIEMDDHPTQQPIHSSSRSSIDESHNMQKKGHATGTTTPNSTKEERKMTSAFAHPATKDGQQIIWVPRDSLGLGQEAVRLMRERKIEATDKDATLNDKAKVEISGPPPDEDSMEV